MVFTSFPYLLVFLPIMALGAYLLSTRGKYFAILWTIAGSLVFYSFWNINHLPLLLFSVIFNYCCGGQIAKSRRLKRALLALGITGNLSLLAYFKYTNFAVDTMNALWGTHWSVQHIVLPLAISFFTFQQIAWLMDQYRSQAPSCNFLHYICAVVFFPHLIAGPIVQYHDLIPQFQNDRSFTICWEDIAKGLFLIGCGVCKKTLIADTLSPYVSLCFDQLPAVNFFQAWLATLAYTMQIYFDFSGYCDIAIGSALLLGISLPENFASPYTATSVREFWQRWHMTLGSFLTRYLYIPLGGSRKGLRRTCINIFVVMALSGIWHGAGFGFLLWGIAHGGAMVAGRLWQAAGFTLRQLTAKSLTFLFVATTWVLFRATDLAAARKVYKGLCGFGEAALPRAVQGLVPDRWQAAFLGTADLFGTGMADLRRLFAALLVAFILVFCCKTAGDIWEAAIQRKKVFFAYALAASSAILLLASFIKMIYIPYTEFIYFNF